MSSMIILPFPHEGASSQDRSRADFVHQCGIAGERFLVRHCFSSTICHSSVSSSSEEDNNSCWVSILDPCNVDKMFERIGTYKFSFYPKDQYLFISSCGGLLCFDDLKGRTVVCNPTTQQLKFLSPPPRDITSQFPSIRVYLATGFGYDSSADDFKVVRIYNHSYYSIAPGDYMRSYRGTNTVVEVYSVKTRHWRDIERPKFVGGAITCDVSAYVLGTYHWQSGTSSLISFDFALENFSISSLPTSECLSSNHLYELLELELKLVAVGYNRPNTSSDYKFVFWTKGPTRSSPWQIFRTISLDFVARPILLKHGLLFLGKMSDDKFSEVIVYDFVKETILPLDGFEGFVFDYPRVVKLVCYKPSKCEISNAQSMNESYTFDKYISDDSDMNSSDDDEHDEELE